MSRFHLPAAPAVLTTLMITINARGKTEPSPPSGDQTDSILKA
ncbi:MAG: hypothetical protein RSD57_00610 [Comamonas sp.]